MNAIATVVLGCVVLVALVAWHFSNRCPACRSKMVVVVRGYSDYCGHHTTWCCPRCGYRLHKQQWG
jgi:transposase-like protein